MWTSGILGPIFMSILFQYNVDKIIVFELITGISLIGPCLLVFLWIARPEPSNPFALTLSEPTSPAPTDTTPSNLKTLRLVLTPTMFLILPGAFATAFEQCFFNGLLPLFIKSGDMSSDLSTKLSLRACISFVQVGSSFFVGALTDRVGSRPMVIACLGLHILCQCLLVFNSPLNNLPVLVAVYVCIGLSNSTLINQSQKLVGVSFPFQTSQAYAGYKFFTSIGAAIGFFGSKYTLGDDGLPVMRIWSPLLISLLILTCLGTFYLSK
ncbi:hypothetical protein BCR33DRAFT_718459 [Rhizoclosmatium globosum]|uniref:MFS general substrate transporter n=1 Tax=Rhizoclosmatium globosum TaxID=329046 RepID=A0A1Y2C5H3_9FUNG|nr:hypothetical protein BCR33DRAFT_718459 [Rhizoclosmatium globosum]|eukprot:ORY42288.1 hypothetical protein BCR33DRAFT_718459 [Rhizoclosmatium globosum]